MTTQTITIFFMRHGEINQPDCLAGHTDFHLSANGREQMSKAANELDVEQVVSSPLLRCSDFARLYAEQRSLPLFIEPAVKELNFGIWDGKAFTALWQMPKPNIGDYWQDPYQNTPEGGEALTAFEQRICQWWLEFIHKVEQDTLVVCHAGVVKTLMALLLELPQVSTLLGKLKIEYASVLKVSLFRDEEGQVWPTLHL